MECGSYVCYLNIHDPVWVSILALSSFYICSVMQYEIGLEVNKNSDKAQVMQCIQFRCFKFKSSELGKEGVRKQWQFSWPLKMLREFVSYLMASLCKLFTETNFAILLNSFFAGINIICYGSDLQFMMTVVKSVEILQILSLFIQLYTLLCSFLLSERRWWLLRLHR